MVVGAPYRVVESLSREQVGDLHLLYRNEWWTKGRRLEDVERMVRHSDYVFGVCPPASERLVAFARVLTDRTYKALIFDVIVAAEERGRGLGALLIERILGHPDLAAVEHFELYCLPEMIPFYERLGFSTDVGGVRLMRRVREPGA
jgi:GNAT superfamily N-acetyltransferase